MAACFPRATVQWHENESNFRKGCEAKHVHRGLRCHLGGGMSLSLKTSQPLEPSVVSVFWLAGPELEKRGW